MKDLKRKKKISKQSHWPYKFICKEIHDHTIWYHISKCLDDAVAVSIKNSLADRLRCDLEPNCFLYYTKSCGLAFTRISELLEQTFLVLVNLLLICMWKLTVASLCVTLWCNVLLWRNYGPHFQVHLFHLVLKSGLDHNCFHYHESNTEFVVPVMHDVQQILYTEICDTFRSIGNEQAKKQMNRSFHENNHDITENSSLLGSSNQSSATSISRVTTKHLPPAKSPTLEAETKPDLSLETSGYVTDKLPGATASHEQHYETKFDEDTPPLSMEETRKNVRPVPKEKDVDSLLQSYQKTQRTPTAVRNTSQPHVQDKTKSPSKTTPSSSVNKPHKSLPRRACLVHHKEQYHLDNNLLSQPRATKYLVKVRTEISPGRFMAKLELQCSR